MIDECILEGKREIRKAIGLQARSMYLLFQLVTNFYR